MYVGDHMHMSHRFVRLGLTRGRAVLVVHLLSFITGAAAVALLWLPLAGVLFVFLQIGTVLGVVSILHSAGPPAAPAGTSRAGIEEQKED